MDVKLSCMFNCILCLIGITLGVTHTHVFNQVALISELVDDAELESGEVTALLAKLDDIKAKIIFRINISETQTNAVPVRLANGPIQSRYMSTEMRILQKAFKTEKEINVRTRRDLESMYRQMILRDNKAGKCELSSAFAVIQTSLQLLNTSHREGQDYVISHLMELLNSSRHIEERLLTSVSLDKKIDDLFQVCTDGFDSLIPTKEVNEEIEQKPLSCNDIVSGENGVYTIYPNYKPSGLQVYCDMDTDEGGWVVFQRRKDGFTDFYRDWEEYKNGFGDLNWEFWLGNDNLHGLTNERSSELRIDLIDENGHRGYAKYSLFKIDSDENGFTLITNGYTGDIGDSLKYHNKRKFSTFDRDNSDSGSCTSAARGAWWYGRCYNSNLNGDYLSKEKDKNIVWHHWHNSYDIKMISTKMKLRWKH